MLRVTASHIASQTTRLPTLLRRLDSKTTSFACTTKLRRTVHFATLCHIAALYSAAPPCCFYISRLPPGLTHLLGDQKPRTDDVLHVQSTTVPLAVASGAHPSTRRLLTAGWHPGTEAHSLDTQQHLAGTPTPKEPHARPMRSVRHRKASRSATRGPSAATMYSLQDDISNISIFFFEQPGVPAPCIRPRRAPPRGRGAPRLFLRLARWPPCPRGADGSWRKKRVD